MSSSATVTNVSPEISHQRLQVETETIYLKASGAHSSLRQSLPSNFLDGVEKLSPEQAGHLRHFHNLVAQLDGEWSLMGSQEPGQEWLDGYRYQLATMAYAAGAAHYHRLPALRSVFKTLFERLIHKMLRRDVWGYWYLTSQGGKMLDPDLKELRKPWADPNVKENIMYSGHLLLMVSLYGMLFNDDKYEKEGALSFDWNPVFWGMGPERFLYNRESLQDTILAEMEKEKWLGVCCEPNAIFVVCNQFPLIGMRYNDIRDGTNIVEDVLNKYKAAWKSKGMIQENGLFVNWYSPNQDKVQEAPSIGFTAWASAFMNSWNPSVAHDTFDKLSPGFLSRVEPDRVQLNSFPVAQTIRQLVETEGADPDSLSTIIKAKRLVESNGSAQMKMPWNTPTFGYIVEWVSEVGNKATLEGLLSHADKFMNPTWRNGGLFYPRNDQETDKEGNHTAVEPFTGNSAIGYARLNIFDGQRKMWLEPWTAERVSSAPYVDGVDLSNCVDFLRGTWDEIRKALIVTMQTWNGERKKIQPRFCNLPPGQYGVYLNGELSETRKIQSLDTSIELQVEVDGTGLDVVLLRSS